ncbi:hypothetical protein DEJ34_05935 [Curtobacterium sp. MCPF17_050]|uniref:hypothetical protein n=1 Tax=Curtobacterium sp. MCPF17_050 TaxID=2175664 RepID=UPI0011B44434|nr:hypothetical protein [Curtobacterium sp. MCPF17_050]WIB16666.1 hypothetical protein DEJ34_05935 [Curtobacterium sp. MCPF17_050]
MRLWGILSAVTAAGVLVLSTPVAADAAMLDRRPDVPTVPVFDAPQGDAVLSGKGTVTFSGTATPNSKVLIGTGDPHDVYLKRTYDNCQNDLPVSGRTMQPEEDVCLEDLVAAGELPSDTKTTGSTIVMPFKDPNVWVWTDANGRFAYDAPYTPGRYSLAAYAETCKQVDMEAGRMLDVDFTGEAPAGVGFTCSQSALTKTVSFTLEADVAQPTASASATSTKALPAAKREEASGASVTPAIVGGAAAAGVLALAAAAVAVIRRRKAKPTGQH